MFGVGRATVKRYLALRRQTGSLDPRPRRGPPPIKTAALAAALPTRLAEAPDATLAEHCAWYEQAAGVRVADTTMSRVIRRQLGWTRKKLSMDLRPTLADEDRARYPAEAGGGVRLCAFGAASPRKNGARAPGAASWSVPDEHAEKT